MSHIRALADLLRSEDPRNHQVAAVVASDQDFVAAVEEVVQLKENLYLKKNTINIFRKGDRWSIVIKPPDLWNFIDYDYYHFDTVIEAALHLKKLLLCETS